MADDTATKNTDREIWRLSDGDSYIARIFVTEGGGIGIDCGGHVIVKPVREWFRLADHPPTTVKHRLVPRPPFELDDAPASPAPDTVGEIGKLREYRVALFMAAAHCQGGHSDAGAIIADLLGVPFPIRMEELSNRASKEGLDPDGLWPWYAKMRAERGDYRKAVEGNDGK